jgi:predicted O-methyltransferase YrrM
MSQYPNWFAVSAIHYFNKHLQNYIGKPNLEFLQIGTYTGDASVWLKDNILTDSTSKLTDVDTWEGSEEGIHKTFDWKNVEQVYDEKLVKYDGVIKYKGKSIKFMTDNSDKKYDFIYIDGDHTEEAVYADAKLAWPLLKTGGILAFDDYTWQHESGLDSMRPAPAIDRFVAEHRDQLFVLEAEHQYWVGKIS